MTLANWIDEKCEEARQAAMAEGRAKGINEGRIEGRAEGRIEGHSSGLLEGRLGTQIEQIRSKYQKGYPIEKTVETLEFDEDLVATIYELLQKEPEASDEEIMKRFLER